jgi:hypothetical protein
VCRYAKAKAKAQAKAKGGDDDEESENEEEKEERLRLRSKMEPTLDVRLAAMNLKEAARAAYIKEDYANAVTLLTEAIENDPLVGRYKLNPVGSAWRQPVTLTRIRENLVSIFAFSNSTCTATPWTGTCTSCGPAVTWRWRRVRTSAGRRRRSTTCPRCPSGKSKGSNIRAAVRVIV